MYLPKGREIKEALISLFSKPYTSKFPLTPYEAPPEFRGKPRFDELICVGCGTCAQVCPTRAITVTDDPESRRRQLQVDYCACMNCGQCEEKCITDKGIRLTGDYSLAVFDTRAPEVYETVQKDLIFCESCGAPVACVDHLRWIKERLGARAYANPNLLLLSQREFFDLGPVTPKDRIRREDYIMEVCARCRKKIVKADEF